MISPDEVVTQDPVIISAYAGGLGDALCFSTLPEMYARTGRTVLIGRPAVEPAIRNPETKRLVWEANPFVSGFVDDVGITFTHREMHNWIWQQNQTRTLVEAMEALHGFEPIHRLPKIYYQPKWRSEVRQTVYADPTSISQRMSPDVFESFVDHVCRARNFSRNEIVVLSSRYSGPQGVGSLCANPRYEVKDIFEYADIIASCRLFITTESGGGILASAIRGLEPAPEIFALATTRAMNDRLFQFPNIRYCATGQLSEDFYIHPDVPVLR